MIRVALVALAVAIGIALFVLTHGCAGSDPRAPLYGAQRALCVEQHDAAAEARACIKAVDAAYGQDAGVR